MTNSNKFDILNLLIGEADFLCQNTPLVCEERQAVNPINRRTRGFLLEGSMRSKLIGRRFGRLIVKNDAGNNKHRQSMWLCLCDCGKTLKVIGQSLTVGNTKSCGCYAREIRRKLIPWNKGKNGYTTKCAKDLTGKIFGRLKVISRKGVSKDFQAMWECICSCGKITVVRSASLRRGTTMSCGCYNKEIVKALKTTHGESNTNLYRVWNTMIQRCENPQSISFKNYGKRGIKVCNEWKEGYIYFRNWALNNGYAKGLSIERKDNNKGYSPQNCCFVTSLVNGNNKRKSRYWIVFGKKFISANQASKYYNVCKRTIRNWCLGNKRTNALPLSNCSAIKKYGNKQCLSLSMNHN